MDGLSLLIALLLLVEIPIAMRSALRVYRRYRARRVNTRILRFLALAAMWIAFVGGGAVGLVVLFAFARLWNLVPELQRGVVTTFLGVGVAALIAFPIALDYVLGRIARGPDPSIEEAP